MTKQSTSRNILVLDNNTYRRLIEYQFTPEMIWSNEEKDQVKPICLFDVSKDEELGEAFHCKNTQPKLKEAPSQKGNRNVFLDYQLQFIKAYQFIKVKEEGHNGDIY